MGVMRKVWGMALLACALAGCGGAGSSTSFLAGKYNGTTVKASGATTIVEINVTANGTVSGTCTIMSTTSAAIVGQAVVTGTADPATGTFSAAGMYETSLPPPPDGSGSGAVSVTGTIPAKGVASGPLQVSDNGVSSNGVISLQPLL